MKKIIGVVTCERDFHAYAVRHELARRGTDCRIIEANRQVDTGALSWSINAQPRLGQIRDVDGSPVAISELAVLWWRRLNGKPQLPNHLPEEANEFVINECRSALQGLMLTSFKGAWVSHPEASRTAENKFVQLHAAAEAGFRIPRTLVSQDPICVREFCETNAYQVIAKSVTGTPGTPTLAGRVTPQLIADEASIRLSPVIYQELIPGHRHLRACCFGSTVITAMLQTERLDWRHPLDAAVSPYTLEADTEARLLAVLDKLRLRMGIFDLKITPAGEIVWLEVNPQGQFLFLEGMGQVSFNLTEAFADFLTMEG